MTLSLAHKCLNTKQKDVIYCINPECSHRQNNERAEVCSHCGTPLLVYGRLKLLTPLRSLETPHFIEVFEVEDSGVKKVLKVLTKNTPNLVEQFEREALCLQLLSHDSIPRVNFDGYFTVTLSNSQFLHCLVMDYIEGQNLEDWLKSHGKISQSLALKWMKQILEILEYIHSQGYFHRDLKPSNIICRPDGNLALIDFGSVRAMSSTYFASIGKGEGITAIISQGYTAPEQINGQALPQSDFYALGRTFVHLLTGIPPFKLSQSGKNGRLLWHQYAKQVSFPFAEYIDELMAISPGERPQSSKIILQHLTGNGLFIESILRRFGSRQFRLKATSVLAGVVFAIAGGWFIERETAIKRAELHLEEAQESIKQKDWETAIKQLETAVKLNPRDVLYQEKLAQAYFQQGRKFLNPEESLKAKEHLEKAVELVPNNADYLHDLGVACWYDKNYSCAEENLQKSIELNSDQKTRNPTIYSLGVVYEDSKDFESAFKKYKIAMKYNDIAGIWATNNFVRLQILKNQNISFAIPRIIEALKKSQELIETSQEAQDKEYLKISQGTLYKNLGWVYLLQGNYIKAKENLLTAIELQDSETALPYCLLAKVKEHLNENDVALAWEKCLNLEGDVDNTPELEVWRLDALHYFNSQGKQP